MPTFTPLSFRRGVLEGGMGVRFPAGLKTLGVVGLLKGACFGMPLSGAAERTAPISGRPGRGCPTQQDFGAWLVSCHFHTFLHGAEATPPAHSKEGGARLPASPAQCPSRPPRACQTLSRCDPNFHRLAVSPRVGGGDLTRAPATLGLRE